jgi:hypothetical protein
MVEIKRLKQVVDTDRREAAQVRVGYFDFLSCINFKFNSFVAVFSAIISVWSDICWPLGGSIKFLSHGQLSFALENLVAAVCGSIARPGMAMDFVLGLVD